jgi:amidophosphoribosyltransferase
MGGFFGVASREDCVGSLFYGTDYHSHLGTRRGGLAVAGHSGISRFIHDITNAQFRSKFEQDLPRLEGRSGIGVISDSEDQPLIIGSHLGTWALVMVGIVRNSRALTARLFRTHGAHFSEMTGSEVNPAEVVAALISSEESFESGIRKAQEAIEGSCSLLLLTEQGIWAARDIRGRTPVILGSSPSGNAVTMETCALPNTGFEPVRDLGPGEVVRVTAEGFETRVAPVAASRICAFLWVYYGYPSSSYEGVNVEQFRYRNGELMARGDATAADGVAGIPDSGTTYALGYSHASGLPFARPFVKYTPTWSRSFMPQSQADRELVARMKLIPVRELTSGHRLLFCDDSIVRGTQLRDTFGKLYRFGAREIHLRIACPPLLYGCRFLNFSRSRSEMDLAGRRAVHELEGRLDEVPPAYLQPDSPQYAAMTDRIARSLQLTSLRYQTVSAMTDAIGVGSDRLCTYCWTGRDP